MDTSNMLAQGTMLRGGTYRIERPLSSGGFGNTYLVRNVVFNELYAMKEFFMRGVNMRRGTAVTVSVPDNHSSYESQKEKFNTEAKRLRALNNAHIVKVHDLFEENGTVYYVMDFINGESLSERMKHQGRPFTEQETWQILPQLLDALKAVHEKELWHMDIKPGNIMLDTNGQAYLVDFGASKQFSKNGPQTSSAMCYTPGYAPVEQVEQDMEKFGPWTDLYALGATLYNMQTLQQPPTSTAIAEGNAFNFPPTMSQRMQDLIRWMMEPSRAKRPASVADIEKQLGVPQPGPYMAPPQPQPMMGQPQPGMAQPQPGMAQPQSGMAQPQPGMAPPQPGMSQPAGDASTQLSGHPGVPSQKKGGALWKILIPLLIVAALGVGAFFLFFNKSPEEKAAEAAREEYEELVDDCKKQIKDAEDLGELLEAKDMLADIEDMDDIHGRVMPEVFNQYEPLKKLFDKTCQTERDECIEEAERLMNDGDYKEACDLLNKAVEALPDDDELAELRDRMAEKIGYVDVLDVKFANCEKDGTDIDEEGSTLYSNKMRYLFPRVYYNSLLPEGHEMVNVEVYYKVFNPDGSLNSSVNSPYGYTNKAAFNVVVGEENQGEWLNGWGNATSSTYSAGEYGFELYYKGRQIYKGTFHIY